MTVVCHVYRLLIVVLTVPRLVGLYKMSKHCGTDLNEFSLI